MNGHILNSDCNLEPHGLLQSNLKSWYHNCAISIFFGDVFAAAKTELMARYMLATLFTNWKEIDIGYGEYKIVSPTRRSIVLGVLLDILSMTASLPQHKIDAYFFKFNAAPSPSFSPSATSSNGQVESCLSGDDWRSPWMIRSPRELRIRLWLIFWWSKRAHRLLYAFIRMKDTFLTTFNLVTQQIHPHWTVILYEWNTSSIRNLSKYNHTTNQRRLDGCALILNSC